MNCSLNDCWYWFKRGFLSAMIEIKFPKIPTIIIYDSDVEDIGYFVGICIQSVLASSIIVGGLYWLGAFSK